MLMKHPDATEAVNVHPGSIERMKQKGYLPLEGAPLEVVTAATKQKPKRPRRKSTVTKAED